MGIFQNGNLHLNAQLVKNQSVIFSLTMSVARKSCETDACTAEGKELRFVNSLIIPFTWRQGF